jgi:hypothetical protein
VDGEILEEPVMEQQHLIMEAVEEVVQHLQEQVGEVAHLDLVETGPLILLRA